MTNFDELREGDTVRVVVEGKITSKDADAGKFINLEGCAVIDDSHVVKSLEVIKPADYEVGDVLTGPQVSNWKAPNGTLVTWKTRGYGGKAEHRYFTKQDRGWVSALRTSGEPYFATGLSSCKNWTVVFIPTEGAN